MSLEEPIDEAALKTYLIAELERTDLQVTDAQPDIVADYVIALVTKDLNLEKLRDEVIEKLDAFFGGGTATFVDALFDALRSGAYADAGEVVADDAVFMGGGQGGGLSLIHI